MTTRVFSGVRLHVIVKVLTLAAFFTTAAADVPAAKTSPELSRLWQTLARVTSRVSFLPNADADILPEPRSSQSCSLPSAVGAEEKALRAQAEAMQQDKGFRFNGYYVTQATDVDDEDDANGYFELSWDLLEQGWRGNERSANRLQAEADLRQLQAQTARRNLLRRCQLDSLHQLFDPLRSVVLSNRLELLEQTFEVEQRAYFKGWSYLDDLLVSERDLHLTRRELGYLNNALQALPEDLTSPLPLPPLLELNLEQVLAAIHQDPFSAQLHQAEYQWVKARYDSRRRNRLRLFVRQEVDDGGSPEDVIAGVRFSVPLHKGDEQSGDYWLADARERQGLDIWEREAIVKSRYGEVREQQQNVIKQYYQLQRNHERVRRSLASYRYDGTGDLTVAITRALGYLSAAEQLVLDIEAQHRSVYDLLLKAQLDPEPQFLYPVALDTESRLRPGERSLYSWSASFNSIKNNVLLELLKAKGINRLTVSAGQRTNRQKLEALLGEHGDIAVELVIGADEWLLEKNHSRALARVREIADLAAAVHLDLEPHRLAAYEKQKSQYLNQYVALIRKIREALPDTHLTLAVPLHWPASTYAELARLADELYLMAYGAGIEPLLTRLTPILNAVPDPQAKLRIVQRTDDFDDEWLLEQRLRQLAQRTPLRKFGLHDLNGLLELMSDHIETQNP